MAGGALPALQAPGSSIRVLKPSSRGEKGIQPRGRQHRLEAFEQCSPEVSLCHRHPNT